MVTDLQDLVESVGHCDCRNGHPLPSDQSPHGLVQSKFSVLLCLGNNVANVMGSGSSWDRIAMQMEKQAPTQFWIEE